MAAMQVFGGSAEYHPALVHGHLHRGRARSRRLRIVPVESSMGGSVSDTQDRFISSDLKIINEMLLHVTQNLLAACPGGLKRVYSRTTPCSNAQLAPGEPARRGAHQTSSTAEAAAARRRRTGAAAIASKMAATTYSLKLLAERIEDAPHNFTRFLVLGRQPVKPTGDDKTSLMVSIKDRPGALFNLLVPFSEAGISLTRIESRPSQKKAWEYVFFIDILGHIDDEPVQKALAKLEDQVHTLKVLGSFPRAPLPS